MLRLVSLVLVLVGCKAAAPAIVSAEILGPERPMLVARTNLAQTYVSATINFAGGISTADGLPIFVHAVAAGTQLLIDRTTGYRSELEIGEPIPAVFRVLFPVPGEAAELGIVFEDDYYTPSDLRIRGSRRVP